MTLLPVVQQRLLKGAPSGGTCDRLVVAHQSPLSLVPAHALSIAQAGRAKDIAAGTLMPVARNLPADGSARAVQGESGGRAGPHRRGGTAGHASTSLPQGSSTGVARERARLRRNCGCLGECPAAVGPRSSPIPIGAGSCTRTATLRTDFASSTTGHASTSSSAARTGPPHGRWWRSTGQHGSMPWAKPPPRWPPPRLQHEP